MARQTTLYIYLLLNFLQIPIGGGLFRSSASSTIFFLVVDLFFFLFAFLFFVTRNFKIDAKLKRIAIIYVLFFGWAIISSSWSQSEKIGYSLALLFRECVRFAIILFLAPSKFDARSLIAIRRAFVHASFLYCLIFVATASYSYDFLNSQGRLMYAGFKDANQPARDIAVFLIFVIWMHQEKLMSRRKALLAMATLLATFALCFSKTSLAALVVSMTFMQVSRRGPISKKMTSLIFVFLFIITVILARLEYLVQYTYEVQGGRALETLSGRTLIWNIYFENIHQFWVFGAGINSFASYSTALPNNPGNVHNDLMNISFNYGVIGLGLYIFIISYFVSAVRKTSPSGKQIAIPTLLFFLVTGISEADLVSSVFSPYLLLLFLIIAQEVSKPRNLQPSYPN